LMRHTPKERRSKGWRAIQNFSDWGSQRLSSHHRGCIDQRLKLPIPPLGQSPAAAQDQASAHQTLHSQDQRKGRALRPDQPARMGLRPSLPNLRSSRPGAPVLASPLQLASTPSRHCIKTAHQQTRPNQGQPLEATHRFYLKTGCHKVFQRCPQSVIDTDIHFFTDHSLTIPRGRSGAVTQKCSSLLRVRAAAAETFGLTSAEIPSTRSNRQSRCVPYRKRSFCPTALGG
jgi:hypothetical protein